MHRRQLANSILRVTHNVPIGGAERIQIPVAKVPDRTQNLRRLAIEHFPETAQAGR
jgi:hypothetical protein